MSYIILNYRIIIIFLTVLFSLLIWHYYKSLRILTFHWECPASAVIQTGIWRRTENNEPNIQIQITSLHPAITQRWHLNDKYYDLFKTFQLWRTTILKRHIIIWNMTNVAYKTKNKQLCFASECLKTHHLHRQQQQCSLTNASF